MINRIILCCLGIILIALLLQTCTKKNDFLLQYKPNITDIDPTEGSPQSIITIKGKGFSSIAEDNQVKINNIEATVVEASTNELKVVVPQDATTGKIRIYIYYKNILIDSTVSTQNFIVHNNYIETPVIYNFLPAQASYNTLIQLTGKNFSNATLSISDTPIVIVGVDTMQVKAFTDTSILFLISKSLLIDKYVVSVSKKNINGEKNLTGFSKNNLEIVASSLQLKETDVMIGDSLHIIGRGLSSAMNVFLSIDNNNKVLCPITHIHDTLLAGKISNDIFQYINPKTSDVFNVSVLFSNQQNLSAGSVRVSITSGGLIWLDRTSVTNIENVNIKYDATKILLPKNAILYLKVNNNIVSQNTTAPTIVASSLTFDKAILKNILGVDDNSKIVQAEIKVIDNNDNETTYALGNLTINAVPTYNPITLPNNLKANDIITITGSHINPDVNSYQLTGFPDTKVISATTATSTAITFKIPADIPAGKYSNIKLNNNLLNISLLTIIPTITNITPLSGGDSTILTITGYNLYTKNKIYFDTISVNKYDSIKYPYNSFKDTVSSKNLVGNTSYVVGIGDSNSIAPLATSSQTFLYTISQFNVFTNNANSTTTATNGDSIKVSGKSIQGKNIILKYNNTQLSLSAIKNNDTLKTKIIESDIATLNIPDNATNIQAQVYIELTNGTQLLAGSIIVKPTSEITGINPNTGSTVKYNDLITISGKHLSSNLGDFEIKLVNNNIIIPLTSANGSSIQFRIPGNIENGIDSVFIKILGTDLQNGKLHNYLKIAPTITSFSPTSGTNNTNITIQGYNFGSNNTIIIDTNRIFTNSTNSQTISFTLPANNNLQAGISYPIKVKTNGDSAVSSTPFTYILGGNFTVSSDNSNITTIVEAGNNLIINGTNLTGISTIVLKYSTASITLPVTLTGNKLSTTTTITNNNIQSLNIPDNKESDVVQVYLQTGSTQTLAGSIIVKPTLQITGINPANGSKVKANDVITITGKHLSSNLGDFEIKLGKNNNIIPLTAANGSSIQFKIPANIASSGDSILIKMNNVDLQKDTAHYHIKIVPTITSISPTSGTSNTLFTIQGYNFDTLNTIYFGNQKSVNMIPSSNSFQTISFSIDDSIQLQAGISYPVKVKTNIDSVVSSTPFTYTLGGSLIVSSNNTDTTIVVAGKNINVYGNNLTGISTIVLKYSTASITLPVTLTGNKLSTTTITNNNIQSLNIPDNKESDVVQVYLQTGSTQTLAGSIIVKPTPQITGINPANGSKVKANDAITITGKHLSSSVGDFNLTLGGTSISLTSANGSSIQFKIPANIASSGDSILIKMNNVDLQQNTAHYHVKIAPTITSISPTSGTSNTLFTIQGYNFDTLNTIYFGNQKPVNMIPSSNSFQTISFSIDDSIQLQAGISYPVKVKTDIDSVVSSTPFTYTLGGSLIVSSNNTDTTIVVAGKNINVYGNNLTGISTIVLKYSTASITLPVTLTGNKLSTTTITNNNIQSLNIPDNKESDVVQVYLQTGSTQTLAGSIIVKPTSEITGINPNTGSTVKYNDLITISGKHLSSNLGDFEIKLVNNNIIIPLTSANGSSIQFRIPGNIENGIDSVFIKILGTDLQNSKLHNYLKIAPTITSFSPTSGTNNTNITIQGYNFGSNNTIIIDTNRIFTNSTNSQTISFTLPANNNLQAGISYPIKVKTNGDSVLSTTSFTYIAGNLNVINVQSLYVDTSHVQVSGTGLQNASLYLRYNNGAYLSIGVNTASSTLIESNPIGKNVIDLLGIPVASSSATIGVYVLAGSTYTFVGNINIKAIPKLYAITSKPTFVAGKQLSINGEHLVASDNYLLGLSRRSTVDTVWYSPTSLSTTALNLIISDTLTADSYGLWVKYKNTFGDTTRVFLDSVIIQPTISSITPSSGIDVLNSFTILGKNLSMNASEITTLLNGIDKSANFSIENATQTSISVKYTNSLTTASNTTAITYPLSLKVNGQISSPLNISLKQ